VRRLVVHLALLTLAFAPVADAAPTVAFTGRGWGHGVGMSQWGAEGFARHGRSYEQILAHYYPGTRLERRPEATVRVLLAAGERRVRIGSLRAFVLVDARGTRVVVGPGAVRLGPRLLVRGRALRSPLRVSPGPMPLRLARRPYRGDLVVRSRGGLLSVVNEIGVERYLRGVVPWEMPDDFHPEALRAQAVAARSYALRRLRPDRIFDLVDDADDQVYRGLRGEQDRTDAAVAATAGRVLTWDGKIALTYYHSTSGGRTAAAADVFGTRVPYLESVDDPFDVGSPHHVRNRVVVTPRLLASKLKAPVLARAVDVTCELNGSGRPVAVVFRTASGAVRLRAARIQEALGVQGTWFEVGVLSLQRPPRVVSGRVVTMVGVARGVGAVALERLRGSTWVRVGSVRARGDGGFARRVRPKRNTTYRLRAGRLTSGSVFVPAAATRRR
jgi:stage II sporulation protein D